MGKYSQPGLGGHPNSPPDRLPFRKLPSALRFKIKIGWAAWGGLDAGGENPIAGKGGLFAAGRVPDRGVAIGTKQDLGKIRVPKVCADTSYLLCILRQDGWDQFIIMAFSGKLDLYLFWGFWNPPASLLKTMKI